MTTVEAVFRCRFHPGEESVRALSCVREVYGIRRISYSTAEGSIRVEYDATRLTSDAVAKLLRGAGFAVTEQVPLIAPQPEAAVEPAPAAGAPTGTPR